MHAYKDPEPVDSEPTPLFNAHFRKYSSGILSRFRKGVTRTHPLWKACGGELAPDDEGHCDVLARDRRFGERSLFHGSGGDVRPQYRTRPSRTFLVTGPNSPESRALPHIPVLSTDVCVE